MVERHPIMLGKAQAQERWGEVEGKGEGREREWETMRIIDAQHFLLSIPFGNPGSYGRASELVFPLTFWKYRHRHAQHLVQHLGQWRLITAADPEWRAAIIHSKDGKGHWVTSWPPPFSGFYTRYLKVTFPNIKWFYRIWRDRIWIQAFLVSQLNISHQPFLSLTHGNISPVPQGTI